MRKSKRDFGALIVGIAALSLLIYLMLNFSPDKNVRVLNISLPSIPLFLALFFVAVYEVFKFSLNQRRGFLISFFATLYLILRFNHLTHPFFLILILALFITFELLFRRRK